VLLLLHQLPRSLCAAAGLPSPCGAIIIIAIVGLPGLPVPLRCLTASVTAGRQHVAAFATLRYQPGCALGIRGTVFWLEGQIDLQTNTLDSRGA